MSHGDKHKKKSYEDIAEGKRIYGRIHLPDPSEIYRPFSLYSEPVVEQTRDDFFGTPQMEAWRKSHQAYIFSTDRILSIVKAYTFHGDRLANTYLRGVLSGLEDLILSILVSPEDIPIAYQIYEHYDFLKGHGIAMPEKKTLMTGEGEERVLDMKAIKQLYKSEYKKLMSPFVLKRLLKAYTDDLQEIIKNAPRLGKPLYTYRGVKNEDFLEPGVLSYINRSFSSTSLSRDVAIKFTESYSGYRCCMYMLDIHKSVPVLCIDSVSLVSNEYEVLIGHNVLFEHDVDVKAIPYGNHPVLTRHIRVRKVPVGDFKPLFMKLSPTKKKKFKRSNFIKINSPRGKTIRKKKGTKRRL